MRAPRVGCGRDQTGVVSVIVAILALVLFGMAAIVIDLGHARDLRRQAQNGADAAALAAGNVLYPHGGGAADFPAAIAAAKQYALANFGTSAAQWPGCTDSGRLGYVPTGESACISFDDAARPTTVRVRLPVMQVGTFLAGIFNVDRISVAAQAAASMSLDPPSQCGLCVVGSGPHNLQNGDVRVAGADIQLNGSVSVGSNGHVSTAGTGSITVQGAASGSNYTPAPLVNQPAFTDPLAFLALPPTGMASLPVLPKTNPCSDGPGKYGSFSSFNNCTLQPGLYVIAGPSGTAWSLTGGASVAGIGVTLYFTCGTPATPLACGTGVSGATLIAGGNTTLAITAPTTGALTGLAVAFDRNNKATMTLGGGGAGSVHGTFYLASGTLQMSGGGCSTYDALFVVSDVTMNGNGACLWSTYNVSSNVRFPPAALHLSQ
jgi:Putative Flp pilus-assembly TadE/G-like